MRGKRQKNMFIILLACSLISGAGCYKQMESDVPQTDVEWVEIEEEVCPLSGVVKQENKNFIHVSGEKLFDEWNQEYKIHGISFANDVLNNPSLPDYAHDLESYYEDVSAMGFNTIRFYMNYGLFEDDNTPVFNYEEQSDRYKETGFEWLDQNIEYAKKYGIRLILNMHYPQGGYQSNGNGTALWKNMDNQTRLVNLWKAIAQRYEQEDTILGYGLVNEPQPIEQEQWRVLAERLVNEINRVDGNHIIFAEISTLLNAPNIVYEKHIYAPLYFTHQKIENREFFQDVTFPNSFFAFARGSNTWADAEAKVKKVNEVQGNWEQMTITYTADEQNSDNFFCSVETKELGKNGIVYIDDIELEEYDENGNLLNVMVEDFEPQPILDLYSSSESGSVRYVTGKGRNGSAAVAVEGVLKDGNIHIGSQIALKEGHTYKLSGWINCQGCEAGATVGMRFDLYRSSKGIFSFDEEGIDRYLKEILQFGKEHQVPIYIGEFGTNILTFQDEKNGIGYISCMLDYFLENDVNFNYHEYAGDYFGVYGNLTGTKNEQLYDLFADRMQ